MGNTESKRKSSSRENPWEGFTDLHNIVKQRNLEQLKQFLSSLSSSSSSSSDKNSIINAKAASGATPLHVAVCLDSYLAEDYLGPECSEELLLDMFNELVKHGADINAKDGENQTPLHLAVEAGYSFIVGEMITTPGCTTLDAMDDRGLTPLMQSCLNGNEKLVELFLQAKASVNKISHAGEITPLVAAIAGNAKNVVRILLEHENGKAAILPPAIGERFSSLRQYARYNPPRKTLSLQRQTREEIEADRQSIIEMLPLDPLYHHASRKNISVIASGSVVKVFDVTKTKELVDFRDLGFLEGHDQNAKAVWSVAYSGVPLLIDNTHHHHQARSTEKKRRFLGATASEARNENKIRIFDAQSLATVAEVTVENRVNSLVFSHDGLVLYAGANEGDIYSFDVQTLQEVGERVAHPLKATRGSSMAVRSSTANTSAALSATSHHHHQHQSNNSSVIPSPMTIGTSQHQILQTQQQFPATTSTPQSSSATEAATTTTVTPNVSPSFCATVTTTAATIARQKSGNHVMNNNSNFFVESGFSVLESPASLGSTTTGTSTLHRDPELAIVHLSLSGCGNFLSTTNKREVVIWKVIHEDNDETQHCIHNNNNNDNESKSAMTDNNNVDDDNDITKEESLFFKQQPVAQIEIPCSGAIMTLFSPQNSDILYTLEVGCVNRWHTKTGQRMFTSDDNDANEKEELVNKQFLVPDRERDYFMTMAISSDGRLLACGTASKRICVYDLEKWSLMKSWSIEKAAEHATDPALRKIATGGDCIPRCLCFVPNTTHYAVLASGSEDGYVRFHVPESHVSESTLVGEPIRMDSSVCSMAVTSSDECGSIFSCGLQHDGDDDQSLPKSFAVVFGKNGSNSKIIEKATMLLNSNRTNKNSTKDADGRQSMTIRVEDGNCVFLKCGVERLRFSEREKNVVEIHDQLANTYKIFLSMASLSSSTLSES